MYNVFTNNTLLDNLITYLTHCYASSPIQVYLIRFQIFIQGVVTVAPRSSSFYFCINDVIVLLSYCMNGNTMYVI